MIFLSSLLFLSLLFLSFSTLDYMWTHFFLVNTPPSYPWKSGSIDLEFALIAQLNSYSKWYIAVTFYFDLYMRCNLNTTTSIRMKWKCPNHIGHNLNNDFVWGVTCECTNCLKKKKKNVFVNYWKMFTKPQEFSF